MGSVVKMNDKKNTGRERRKECEKKVSGWEKRKGMEEQEVE